jgi:hypothetical protein
MMGEGYRLGGRIMKEIENERQRAVAAGWYGVHTVHGAG